MENVQDIELDADGAQGSMSGGAPLAVRKVISLNLTKKTKLKAKSSAKSSKSKKERRDRDGDDSGEAKTSRRSKASEKKREATNDDREDEELDWSHEVMLIGEKMQNPMIHICEKCSLPILIYGRLSPCKHVFCLSCAEKSNGKCTRCDDRIERVEPAGIGQIFVCSFGGSRNGVSGCRRSYLSQRDLVAHIKHRHEKEGSTIPESELMRQQGVVRMPFLNATSGMIMQPSISIPNASQANALTTPVMIPPMAPLSQPSIFVDANRMPILPSQPPFQPIPQNIPLAQPQYPAGTYVPQNQTQYQGIPQVQPPQNMQNPQSGQRPEDIQGRSGTAMPPGQAPPPPPPPQGDWRGNNQITSGTQEWGSQGRIGNYQQQSYYK